MKSGWVTKKLGEVCEITAGNSAPQGADSFSEISDRCFLRVADMGQLHGTTIDSTRDRLSDEPKGLRLFPSGSVVFTKSGASLLLNQRGILARPMHVVSHIGVLIPSNEISSEYLYYWMCIVDFGRLVKPAHMPSLRLSQVAKLLIPIPPLAEQKQIVAKIDAAFEKIDKLKANAEKNLANAKKLFQSALDEAMRPKDGCNFVSLTSVSEKIFAGGDKPEIIVKESTENIKIPIYSNGENNDGLYGYTQYATVVKPAVTVSARGTIGFCSIRRVPYVPIVRLISVIPNDKVLLEYLYYSLKSLKIKNTGSSIPQLTVPMIKEFHLPMRPLSEQREIVKRLDLLAEKIKILEENYTQQIADCVEMRQAVLREAFEGRL